MRYKFSHFLRTRVAMRLWGVGVLLAAAPGWADVKPVVNREYLPAVLQLIAEAKQTIDFLQLEYHDDKVMRQVESALAEAVKRGVKVRGLLENGIDFNAAGARRLRDLGAMVKLDTPRKMLHSKLVVVDGERVLLGSSNWTGNSLANNNETNVRLDDPALAGFFLRYIEALWADSQAEPEAPPVASGSVKTVVNRQYFPEVLALLQGAERQIRVIMYGIKYDAKYAGSKVNQLVEALAAAQARGVDVAVIMDRSDYNDTLNQINEPAKQYLAGAGVAVYDDPIRITTHAKMILADDRVLIGSANWGYDALERRNETCVLINEPEIAAFFREYFDHPDRRAVRVGSEMAP